MKKKLIFYCLSIFFISCSQKEKSNCNFTDFVDFSIHKGTAVMKFPKELLSNVDTVLKQEFERNENLVYSGSLFSKDSLSYVFITGIKNSVNNKGLIEYGNMVRDSYMSVLKYDKNNYLTQMIDTTVSNRPSYRFVFLTKKHALDIAFAGVIFCRDSLRFDVFVQIDSHNFNVIQKRIECIINSVDD